MSFNPSEYGLQPLDYEQDGESGPMTMGNEAQANHLEAMRLAGMAVQHPGPQVVAQPQSHSMVQNRRMGNVERRLAKAQYYRVLMDGALFDSPDALAAEVEEEMKTFILSRMEALVGEDPTVNVEKFTPEEVKYLKLWANTLKAKAEQPTPQPAAAPPRQTPTLAAPAPVAAPQPPPGPTLRKARRAPSIVPAATAAPQQPVERPVRKSAAPKPGKARPPAGQPQPIPVPQGNQMAAVMAQKAMIEAGQQTMVETNPNAPRK